MARKWFFSVYLYSQALCNKSGFPPLHRPGDRAYASSSCLRQLCSACFCASLTAGYWGSSPSSVRTTISEISSRANHFLSAGMTYQGAALEAVALMQS